MSFPYKISAMDVPWSRASDISRFIDKTSYEYDEVECGSDDPTRLPYFKACLFAAVLEDALLQLTILGECNATMSISRVMTEMTSLLAKKYGVKEEAVKDELDGIDPKNLHCVEYTLAKLRRDRDFVMQVLKETYFNFSLDRNFESLTQYVNAIETEYTRRSDMTQEESKNKIRRHEVYRQLRQHRNHIKSVTYDTTTEIEALKSYLEDAELIAESRSRFMDNWQRSCTEQHLQIISNKEIIPFQNIEHFKMKFEQEQRVHTEIEILNNIKINETLEKVQDWMKKYDKDMEGIDLKIQLKKNDYDQTYDRRLELENTIKKHADLIVSWNTFKEKREAARLYREKMTNAAIMVQAWWRGLLVRQQLGPYKVAKRKGDKKKKK